MELLTLCCSNLSFQILLFSSPFFETFAETGMIPLFHLVDYSNNHLLDFGERFLEMGKCIR